MPIHATLETVQKSKTKEGSPDMKLSGLVTPVKSTKVVGLLEVKVNDNNKSI